MGASSLYEPYDYSSLGERRVSRALRVWERVRRVPILFVATAMSACLFDDEHANDVPDSQACAEVAPSTTQKSVGSTHACSTPDAGGDVGSEIDGAESDGAILGEEIGAEEGGVEIEADAASERDGEVGGSVPECKDEGFGVFMGANGPSREVTDRVYASMTPVDYEPAEDRWQNMPNTAARLCTASELRVVMLGDSIINDTSSSRWEVYVEEATGSTLLKTTTVRGSSGPIWYREENRIYCGASRYNPDLVILGGISQPSVSAMRDVVKLIREQSSAEILLMTPAFGSVLDPANSSTWAFDPVSDPSAYRLELRALAEEVDIGFLDMTAHWGRYIRESGRPLADFKRDYVHANEQGAQILGRILALHLDPHRGGAVCASGARTAPDVH